MNNIEKLLWVPALLLLLSAPLLAQDIGIPDTVYFGNNGLAYGYSGNVYRIPIYIATDQPVVALSLGMEYGYSPAGQVFDSLSKIGSIFEQGSYLDISHGVTASRQGIHPPNPDTVMTWGVAADSALPIGRYKLCDLFFTGAAIGQQIQVDSAFVPPAATFVLLGSELDAYTPEFRGPTLTIVAGDPSFNLLSPSVVSGDVGTAITFPVEVSAAFTPAVIVFDSLREVADGSAPANLPTTTGTNPLNVVWVPTLYQFGNFVAYFTATDAALNKYRFPVTIMVSYVNLPCYNMMGDANCDEIINVTDAVYLINYIFGGGEQPGCHR